MRLSDLVAVRFEFFADQEDGRAHRSVQRLLPVRVLEQEALMRLETHDARSEAGVWFQQNGGTGPSRRISDNGWTIERGTDAGLQADTEQNSEKRSA